MSAIVNMPIGGYPLAMYGMAALTTAVLAYATISGSGSPASVESTAEKSGEGMLSGLFGAKKTEETASSGENSSKGGVMESLGNMISGSSSSESSPSPSPTSATTGGSRHKKKHRKTKNKRAKRRSEKQSKK